MALQPSSHSSAPDLKAGIYQHYKGGRYLVLMVATLESSLEPCVVYVGLGENLQVPSHIWVRPLDDFTASVTVHDLIKPRFTYLGPAA